MTKLQHPSSATRGPGRRPGSPDTRAAILAAARELFAAHGFAGTTIRAVGAQAEVDPAMVHHYFGTKDDLFLAALELQMDPREVMAPVIAGGPDGAGARLPLIGVMRGIFDASGQRLVRDGFLRMVLGPVGAGLGIDEPDRRMPLVASQIVGLVMIRYVLAVEPLASLPAEQVVATYAPTLQRYLTGPLP